MRNERKIEDIQDFFIKITLYFNAFRSIHMMPKSCSSFIKHVCDGGDRDVFFFIFSIPYNIK